MKYILTLAVAIMLATGAYAQGNAKHKNVLPTGFAQVELPALPHAIDFAGESVPLHNYDTRESLLRELLINCYMHSRTYIALLNSERYFSIIEPILRKNGIPLDFKYLCVAESGLNPDAVSSARAGGLWQIMPGTGSDYGLEIGPEVDERFHIEKATEVACAHLRKSYERFGSWTLAAAAYNLGDAGVERRIEKQGLANYYDIFMPEETRRYVFRILSFKLIFADPAAYGYDIRRSDYFRPLTDYHMVEICDANIDWSAFAAANGTTYRMLRELNHWIRDYQYENIDCKTYTVKIPNASFRSKQ